MEFPTAHLWVSLGWSPVLYNRCPYKKGGEESSIGTHGNTARLTQKDLQASLGYALKIVSRQNMTEKQEKKKTVKTQLPREGHERTQREVSQLPAKEKGLKGAT